MVRSEDNSPDLGHLRTAYFAFQLAGGHIGLPLLVLIFLSSRRVYRPTSVVNFCLTWIVYSVSYSLLLYTNHDRAAPPPIKLCMAQAAMIHGTPPMAVVAGLEVVIQLYSTFQLPWPSRCLAPFSRVPRWVLSLLIATPPYLVFTVFALIAVSIGLKDPSPVTFDNRIYCSITRKADPFEVYAVPVFCAVMLGIITAVEGAYLPAAEIYRRWLHVKHTFPLVERRHSLSPLLRVSFITLYTLASLTECISFLTDYVGPLGYMIQATLPLVATLVFGSQRDVFYFLFGWLYGPKVEHALECVQGGGWSVCRGSRTSPQQSGHTSLTSEA